MEYTLTTPIPRTLLQKLRAGDSATLSGTIYTARDAAHARIAELLQTGKPLPFPLAEAIIYYAGPTPTPPGAIIGAVGPTTAGRMDQYTPALLRLGLAAMIGKGTRTPEVLAAMRQTGAVYFGLLGGAGALAAACITSCKTIAFEDLGSEAVRELTVANLPLTVLADSIGGDLYQSGPQAYLASLKEGYP